MYSIRQISSQPAMYLIDNFVSPKECKALIQSALKKGLSRSETINAKNKKIFNKRNRNSKQASIHGDTDRIVTIIQKRLITLTKLSSFYLEPLKVCCYKKHGHFSPHYDFLEKNSFFPSNYAERLITVMMYLNNVTEGGETEFPNLGFRVIPKRGRAIIWYNYIPLKLPTKNAKSAKIPRIIKADSDTLHAGLPVIMGEKWIATQWFHYKMTNKKGKIIKI